MKTTKTKSNDAEHQVATATVNTTPQQNKVQIPVAKVDPEKVTVNSKVTSAPKASSENKPKAPKKPKDSPNKPTTEPVIQKAANQIVGKEKSAKVSVKKIDLFADEESDHAEWQSVPAKHSKTPAVKSGSKTANTGKGDSKKKQPEHEKDKQGQGNKLEVSSCFTRLAWFSCRIPH